MKPLLARTDASRAPTGKQFGISREISGNMKSAPPTVVPSRSLRSACVLLFLLLTFSLQCYSAEVVFISSPEGSSAERSEVEIVARFYGVTVMHIRPSAENDPALTTSVQRPKVLAVIIAADALNLISQKALVRAIEARPGGSLPLLILGVSTQTDATLLRTWSGGAVVGCRRLARSIPIAYDVGFFDGLTRQLSGIELPSIGSNPVYLLLSTSSRPQRIIDIRQASDLLPMFVENTFGRLKVFLASAPPVHESQDEPSPEHTVAAFTQIAPLMMFMRYCAGDKGWHAVHHYSNLTVDDPWLREPYGFLSYKSLLSEMEKHNFHSTIAFIPWNYDRSDPRVVSLIRAHPDKFSICIHGDNHDNKEFTDYRNKPLSGQTVALQQSLARMNSFQKLTGIPYDNVMVFPHSIAPEQTLGALKAYNYLATINSSNVPMHRMNPPLLPFALRAVTLSFADFPSIRRYSVEAPIPDGFIAVNKFLENPLFFYGHQEFFSSGIDAFDRLADEVNRIEPDTRWRSAGEIVKHLYLIKQRDEEGYDVIAFSNNFCLENVSFQKSTFYIKKQESGQPTIESLTVDGLQVPYRIQEGYIDLAITIPSASTRCVVIKYVNDLQLATTDISRRSARVYCLRMASDFRDITLSKVSIGRAVIRFYYKHNLTPMTVLICLSLFILCCLVGGWCLRSVVDKHYKARGIARPS